jgi:nucleoside-diphosphate kinase
LERTLFIVKPDAVERGLVGRIIAMIEEAGLRIVALKMTHLDDRSAGGFYQVHKGKPFFDRLVAYMTSGRIVAGVAEGNDAITHLRSVCGATDPAAAASGTIRATYGVNLTMNSIHASDSPSSAGYEIKFFFADMA